MSMDKEKEARRYVHATKNFYKHLATYVIVMIVLIIINLIREPNNLWFLWVGGIWGAILLAQFISRIFLRSHLNADWEKKKMDEYMGNKSDNKKEESDS